MKTTWRPDLTAYCSTAKKAGMKVNLMTPRIIRTSMLISSEDDCETDAEESIEEEDIWSEAIQKPDRWPFTDTSGIDFDAIVGCNEPIDFYQLYVDDELINFIVDETNRYGHQKNPHWTSTTVFELKKLLALTMQMGIVKLPALRDYWSGDTVFGGHPLCAALCQERGLKAFCQTSIWLTTSPLTGRTGSIRSVEFIHKFNQRCQEVYRPGEEVCIDESLIPFRGRIIFRQYIPNKRHRYGIKAFKLCSKGGYTYRMSIYAGKQEQPRIGSVAEDVVMRLMEGLLDYGRTLYTDNWYTSVVLAKKLLQQKTDLIGTVRKNRRGLPKVVTGPRLSVEILLQDRTKMGFWC